MLYRVTSNVFGAIRFAIAKLVSKRLVRHTYQAGNVLKGDK